MHVCIHDRATAYVDSYRRRKYLLVLHDEMGVSTAVRAGHLYNGALHPAVAAGEVALQLEFVVGSIDDELTLAVAVRTSHAANDTVQLYQLFL